MYIFSNLISNLSSLIYLFLKKKPGYLISYLHIFWKNIFENLFEFIVELKMIYFTNLKNFKSFLKIFIKMKNRLLLHTSTDNYKNINKLLEIKRYYAKYLYINIFDKKLYWLNLKKFYIFKETSIFNLVNQIQYLEKIKCILCSNITFIYNCIGIFDFICSSKKNNVNYQYSCLLVYNHLCYYCKQRTHTEHKLYFIKIPLKCFTSTIPSLEKIFLFIYVRLLFFIASSQLLKIDKKKKSFSNKLIFKQFNLFFLKNISLKSITYSLYKKKIISLALVYCPDLKIFKYKCYLSKKFNLKRKTSYLINKISKNKKKYLRKNKLTFKFLYQLKKIIKYNKIKIKFLLGRSKNLDLFLNYIK